MIYLDSAATTRVCPEAVQAAVAAMTQGYGNPSSGYPLGREAAAELATARQAVATALGCESDEVLFTSCGTESSNWAIRGAVERNRRKGRHIITSAIEHAAVLEPLRALAREGYEVTYLKPDATGHLAMDDLAAALRPDTVLVSLMLVNNELGSVQNLAAAAQHIKASGAPALFHTDAVQGFLKVPFTPQALGVDLLSVSGHKVHAPKGVGALYVKRGLKLPALLYGGGQEGGLRPGTEATAQIAAFAAACKSWSAGRQQEISALKDYAAATLGNLPCVTLLGGDDAPHILALALPGYPSEMLVRALGDLGICVSSGSACHRGKPSHVFAALGLPKQTLMGVVRISFSHENSKSDVDALADGLRQITQTRLSLS